MSQHTYKNSVSLSSEVCYSQIFDGNESLFLHSMIFKLDFPKKDKNLCSVRAYWTKDV